MEINYTHFFIKMLIGGFVLATTGELVVHVSPMHAGLFWSFPLGLILSYLFLTHGNISNIHISQFFATISFGLINIAAFCITLSVLTYNFPDISAWHALFYGILAWIGVGYFMLDKLVNMINYYY